MKSNIDAERRLLDLLSGWANYLDDLTQNTIDFSKEDMAQYQLELDKVADLYQAVPNINFNSITLTYDEPTSEQIEQFIKNKVIPLILNGE
jgi:hypothetical protein